MISQELTLALVFPCTAFGLAWGIYNTMKIRAVNMEDATHLKGNKKHEHNNEEGEDDQQTLLKKNETTPEEAIKILQDMKLISQRIEEGAITFLKQEYTYLILFLMVFGAIIYFAAEPETGYFYTTAAFLIGGTTSIISGYIGMRIAVYTNVRATKECCEDISKGFVVAYRGGQVLGFVLVSLALLVLEILILVYKKIYLSAITDATTDDVEEMFDMIAGYGLGGSTVALFGRVGGGIYTKAADVGSDLAGKVVAGLPEDDKKNPGVIADNVGDNVGDIAGMGSDLFGSLAESSCAALVVGATSSELCNNADAIYFPLLITSVGIIVSFVTTFFATNFTKATMDNVESIVKWQLIISTVLMSLAIIPILVVLPSSFTITLSSSSSITTTPWKAYACVMSGLWSGLCIGYVTELYTSNSYSPVQELVEACRMGAAPNIILGLALGYMSNIVPILCISATIYIAFSFAGMYGIALGALGMLGCLPIALAIDGYGPISDNAGGIAEMAELDEEVRKKTDKLDAAGNTTAAIGKGFAIGSACLVSLALFGAFVTRVGESTVDILQPLTFAFLLIGAMIPYAFSALTMAAVGQAANDMIAEIQRQFMDEGVRSGAVEPDYDKCIQISTNASLKKMIAPGLLVICTPLVTGFLFGTSAVSGLLAGNIVSGVQIAISFSNTGGAWDNCKKYIEANVHKSKQLLPGEEEGHEYVFKKGSDAHKAAVVGDTVGDPLKDTSGPSINILIKLSAITSLVFGEFFVETGFLVSS